MNSFKKLTLLLTPLIIIGCASRPSDIEPLVVAESKYDSLTCQQLVQKLNAKYEALAIYTKAQDAKATSDAGSSTVFLVPASLFTGSYEKEVALHKGEVIALKSTLSDSQCDTSMVIAKPDVSKLRVEDITSTGERN